MHIGEGSDVTTDMSGHNDHPNTTLAGHLGNIHGK